MAEPNDENAKALVELQEQYGLDVGQVYQTYAGWPLGTQLVFTDGGIFVTVPGVPGAYCLTDGRRVVLRGSE